MCYENDFILNNKVLCFKNLYGGKKFILECVHNSCILIDGKLGLVKNYDLDLLKLTKEKLIDLAKKFKIVVETFKRVTTINKINSEKEKINSYDNF